MNNANLFVIFTTGLLTGGLTCLAVQGGLLAATIAQREEEKLKEKTTKGQALPITVFVTAKLVAYTALGALLGWLGSLMELSLTAKVVLQFIVVAFMLGTALDLLKVHPIFRYFVIQPPKFLRRFIRNRSKSADIFGPAMMGAFTVFLPCGTTQAMMALAIASGSPLLGSAILFSFILGTTPLFFILGYFATKLGEAIQAKFFKVAAYAIIILAIFNFNSALALTGSTWTLSRAGHATYCAILFCEGEFLGIVRNGGPVQDVTIKIEANGYSPNHFAVKSGSNVTIHLVNDSTGGCAQAFTIPRLNIQKIVPPGNSGTLEFTAPKEPGQITFMCSMGMYAGTIDVL